MKPSYYIRPLFFKKPINLMKFTSLVVVILLAVASSISSYAQGVFFQHYPSYADAKARGFQKMWQRNTVGYSLRFASAKFSMRYKDGTSGAPSLYRHIDTSTEKTVHTELSGSWGCYSEQFAPIAMLDDQGILAFSYGGYVDFFKFKIGEVGLIQGGKPATDDAQGMAGGFLLGLDYRVGGDAFLDKSRRGMFNIGAGISPSFLLTRYNPAYFTDERMRLKMIPYIKAEVGFFLGIAFKLRGDMLFGKAVYVDSIDEGEDDRTEISMKGDMYGFRLSLAIMPYSWDWGSDY